MVDIASLAIEIDTSDVARAETELDRLSQRGARAEQSAQGVGEAYQDASRRIGGVAGAAADASEALDRGANSARNQTRELADLVARIDPAGAAMRRLADEQEKLTRFRDRGLIDTAQFDQLSARLEQSRAMLERNGQAMQNAGLSAGQYSQAMRMLPMQLTDVAVSLASGMPLWMVLIQQGGQVRDSFGGIGNAARAVVSTLGPMNLALGGAAAAAAALLLAYQQGANEAAAYNKALILTGNSAGTSADQLAVMAERIDLISGTQRQAAAALAEITATGKFTADQIEAIGTAAVAMENATGKAVSDTVKEFARLADEPVAASAKLNEQYNYLTASVYEQIRALEEQGRETEAAKLATDTYASAMQQRSGEIEGNLGTLERAWRSIGRTAAEAWDAMLDLGREDSLDEQLASVEERLRNARSRTGLQAGRTDTGGLEQERTRLQLTIQQRDAEAEWAKELAGLNQEQIKHSQLIDKLNSGLKSQLESTKELSAYEQTLNRLKKEGVDVDSDRAQEALGLARSLDAQEAADKAAAEAEKAGAKASREAAAAARQRAEETKRLLDKLLPASAAEREHAKSLATLEGLLNSGTIGLGEYQEATENLWKSLNADAWKEQARAAEEANREIEQYARELQSLEDRLDPAAAAARKYSDEQDLLNRRIAEGGPEAAKYQALLGKLGEEYEQSRLESSAWGKWTQDALERVDSAFADMWKGVGGGFDSFADGLKSAFSQLLAELAHMAITRPIIVQIGSALGIGGLAGQSAGIWGSLFGGSDSSGGSGSGLLGSLSNAYSLYQAGTGEGLLGSVVSGFREGGLMGAWDGLGDYGGGLSNAVASLFSGGAGVNSMAMGATQAGYTGAAFNSWVGTQNLANTLQGVATWAGPLAGAFAGYQAGGLGGAAVGGLGAWGGAAAGTAIGTAIGGTLGSVLPGIGTAIGAAIGSWAGGKLFGGSGERFKETYTTSSGYYDDGEYQDTGDLAVFSGRRQFGDDYDSYLSGVNRQFTTALGSLYETFGDGAQVQADIAGRLRRTSGAIAGDLWTNIDGESFHRTARYGEDGKNIAGNLEAFSGDVMGEWLAQAIVASDSLPQYMRDQFADLAKDKGTTPEQVQEVLSGIIGRFEGVNSVLELVGISAMDATDAGLRAGDAIIELAGGMEQLQAGVSTYYDQFFTESEKVADTLENIPAMFDDAGVELPSIRAEYRAMVEDIDVTTAAGQSMFATLMSLAGSADAYYDILEAQAAAAEQAAAEAAAALLQSELNYYDLFTAEAQKTDDALAGVRAQFAALSVSLPDTRAGFAQAIEALDLTTESGRSMYETMLGLASAADGYYDTLEARAAAAAEAQAAEVGEEEGLLDRLRESRIALAEAAGDTATAEALRAQILQEERDALYESNRAIYDQIQAVNAQAAAAQAAAEAAAASAEAEQAYYAAFASAAQQQRDSIAEVTEAFEAAGVVLPASREQFAALVESIDTGTTSGQQLRQVLIGLADDADTAYTALEAMRESARSAVDAAISTGQQAVSEAQQAVMDAYQAEASGLDSVIDSFERFTESLRDFRGELGDAALEMQAPDRQLAELRRQFESVAAAAAGGDQQAMAELPEIGGRLAEAAREMSSSREDYLRQLAYLDSETADAEAAAGEQVSVAQQQLDALDDQLAALELAGEAQQSFADAVLQLLQAQMEADRLLSEAERQALSVEMRWLSGALSAPLGAGGAIVAALSAGFDAVDIDTDGLLDQSELRAALVETGLLSEADLPAVAAMLDRNRDGVISAIEAQDALLDVHAIAASRNFAALDSSLDGLLDAGELKAALVDSGLLTSAELDTLLVRLDANNDGLIDAQEATGAAISAAASLMRGGLETIDTSLDGLLSKDELSAALVDTGLLTGAELDRLIAAVDTNGDGLIDAIEQGSLDLIAQFGQYADDVSSVYREVLGRDADAPGLDYWADLIESGAISVDKLVDAILAGAAGTNDQAAAAAYANSVVDSAYQDILGRSADAPSLDYWSAALQSGAIAVGSLPEVIAASAVNGAAGSDRDAAMGYIDDIVGSAYQAVLGREADAAGSDWWSSLLGSGRVQFEDFPGIFAVSAFSGPDGDDKTSAARYLGIPGYASGGDFGGGLRLVGERGPELEVTGPSRIYSASQTAELLSGGGDSAAIGRLERAISGLQDGIRAIAKHTMKTAKNTELLPPVLEQNEAFAI